MKRVLLAATFSLAAAFNADAISADDKACITNAAEQVPRIAGTEITASRVTPAKFEDGADPGDMVIMDVELDVKAAGIEQTYVFTCFWKKGDTMRLIDPRGIK